VQQSPQIPQWSPPQAKPSSGFATAALVLGIISFFLFPIIFGPAGIICGVVAKSRNEPNADRGLVVSIIGLVGGMIFGVIVWGSVGF
jgi:hypothetical protein